MCQSCGCTAVLKQSKEAIRKRAAEIVAELSLNAGNVADYEDTELISSLIVPFGPREDDVTRTAAWIAGLHSESTQGNLDEQYKAYQTAFRAIFASLPAKGDPKKIITVYHQLEQLNKVLDDASLVSLNDETRQALLALRRVHDDRDGRVARLKARYKLP